MCIKRKLLHVIGVVLALIHDCGDHPSHSIKKKTVKFEGASKFVNWLKMCNALICR